MSTLWDMPVVNVPAIDKVYIDGPDNLHIKRLDWIVVLAGAFGKRE